MGFAAQRNDEIDVANECRINRLGVSVLMSMPISARDAADSALMPSPGLVPPR